MAYWRHTHWQRELPAGSASATSIMGGISNAVRSAILGGGGGVLLYWSADLASDIYIYSAVRKEALAVAEQNEDLKQLVGTPYRTGG